MNDFVDQIHKLIDRNPTGLETLSDSELFLLDRAQEGAGSLVATQLCQLVGCAEKAAKLVNKTLKRPAEYICKGASKAHVALNNGEKVKPEHLASLVVWTRAQHNHITAEMARREAQNETIQ